MNDQPTYGPLTFIIGALAGAAIGHLVFSKGPGRRVLAPAENPYHAPWSTRMISRGVRYVYDEDGNWIGSIVGESGNYVGARGLGSPDCGPFSRMAEAANCLYAQARG